jgi:hypothetical protein
MKLSGFTYQTAISKKLLAGLTQLAHFLLSTALQKNPNGFYVYRIRDMEAELECRQGNKSRALFIAEENLRDAKEGKYTI